jgi:hypothetical protein
MKIINHNELKEVINISYNKQIPMFIWGACGIGKSSIVKQCAKDLGIDFIDVRISQLEPCDLRGLPSVCNGETKWLSPNWLPKSGKGILFFDELNLAVPSIQASCYQLILDRQLGDYKLPDGWVIISAGNRFEDKANVFEMPSPLANRFIHIELSVPSIESWCNWAFDNQIDSRIIAFLNFKNSRLFSFDSKNKDKAFATPRTWEYTSKLIKGCDYETNKDILDTLIASSVGEGIQTEMSAFMKLQRKVKAEDILANPKKVKDIKEIDLKYSLLASISEYYGKHKKKETIKQILGVVDELEAEFGILLLRLSKGVDTPFFINNIKDIPQFKEMSQKYAKYLL